MVCFLAHGELVNPLLQNSVADTWGVRHFYGAARGDFNFGLDDVSIPIALAGGNVTGQHESSQRGHRNVVRAPDPRLEHSARPDGNFILAAIILDLACLGVAAYSSELNVQDAAGL